MKKISLGYISNTSTLVLVHNIEYFIHCPLSYRSFPIHRKSLERTILENSGQSSTDRMMRSTPPRETILVQAHVVSNSICNIHVSQFIACVFAYPTNSASSFQVLDTELMPGSPASTQRPYHMKKSFQTLECYVMPDSPCVFYFFIMFAALGQNNAVYIWECNIYERI